MGLPPTPLLFGLRGHEGLAAHARLEVGFLTMAKAKSGSSAVSDYLKQLPSERREEVERVRNLVRENLPMGYEETVTGGMIVYQVPWEVYSDTYNGHPLWYAAIGVNKSNLSLHLMTVYGDAGLAQQLKDGFKAAGKKLDIGKACIRFQSADDLATDVVGKIVASVPMEKFVAVAKAARQR